MSKKKERIKYLVGIRNAINKPDVQPIMPDDYLYNKNTIKSVLKTIDHLLAEDGIFPMKAESKVNK
jgi:hypothetical protein